MPKLKTKSGAKKRFKVTASGKVLFAQSGKRHGMIKRTTKQIREHRGTKVLFKTDGDRIRKYWLPNGWPSRRSYSPHLPSRVLGGGGGGLQPTAIIHATKYAKTSKEIRHGPRQTGRHRTCQAQESPQSRQGLLWPAQEHHTDRQAGGRKGQSICVSRPQTPQAH